MKRNLWLVLAACLCAVSLWGGLRSGGGAPPDRAPELPSGLHLRILNGTQEAGLARDVGLRLGASGQVIEGVGNAERPRAGGSLLVNRRLDDAVADRLAARLGGVTVIREWDNRCSEDAVLVLGADWSRVVAALAEPD